MNRIILICAVVALCGCTVSERKSTDALEAQGLDNVQLGGWPLFGCDEKDTFKRSFKATNARGDRVSGVICGGWLKDATVRISRVDHRGHPQ